MPIKETIFTNQEALVFEHYGTYNSVVPCFVCKKMLGLSKHDLDGAKGLTWFDPYPSDGSPGKYCCFGCLSEKRKIEIKKIEGKNEY